MRTPTPVDKRRRSRAHRPAPVATRLQPLVSNAARPPPVLVEYLFERCGCNTTHTQTRDYRKETPPAHCGASSLMVLMKRTAANFATALRFHIPFRRLYPYRQALTPSSTLLQVSFTKGFPQAAGITAAFAGNTTRGFTPTTPSLSKCRLTRSKRMRRTCSSTVPRRGPFLRLAGTRRLDFCRCFLLFWFCDFCPSPFGS